jgi:hypothetical protein
VNFAVRRIDHRSFLGIERGGENLLPHCEIRASNGVSVPSHSRLRQ